MSSIVRVSVFLAGPDIYPLSLPPFLTPFPKRVPRRPRICFSLMRCHSGAAASSHAHGSPFLTATTAIYRDSAGLSTSGWLSLLVVVASQFLFPPSLPSPLVHTVFPGCAPKVWKTALPGFDGNFSFTDRWLEEYIMFLSSSEIEDVSFAWFYLLFLPIYIALGVVYGINRGHLFKMALGGN